MIVPNHTLLAGLNLTSAIVRFLHARRAAAVPFDTIHILTLPAFHWIRVDYNPQSSRFALSFNAVGGSQILTTGGLVANSKIDVGDYHDISRSTYITSEDPFKQGLAISDMTTLEFATQYVASAPLYAQSYLVQNYNTNQ